MKLTVDYAFKKVFGEKKSVCLAFLNSILAERNRPLITDLTFLNTDHPKNHEKGKSIRLDILAKLQSGELVNIEMQANPQDAMGQRTLFYWTIVYNKTLKKGDGYKKAKKVICINILDHNIWPEYQDRYHFSFALKEQQLHFALTEDLEIHFLALPHMPQKCYNEMTPLEQWLFLIKGEATVEQLEELSMQNNALKEAIEELKILSQDHDAWDDYTQREKDLRDYITNAQAAEERGKAEGRAEGQVEGKAEAARKAALALKIENIPVSTIIKATGLTKEEIEKL